MKGGKSEILPVPVLLFLHLKGIGSKLRSKQDRANKGNGQDWLERKKERKKDRKRPKVLGRSTRLNEMKNN